MVTDYEKMLHSAKEKLPDVAAHEDRFVVPNVKGHVQGNKTIISNFFQIASFINRKPENLLKYVLKELATPGEVYKKMIIFGSKVSASKLNEKIQQFVDEFVVCRECSKPDTTMKKEGNLLFITCQACGAKYRVAARF